MKLNTIIQLTTTLSLFSVAISALILAFFLTTQPINPVTNAIIYGCVVAMGFFGVLFLLSFLILVKKVI